MGKKRNAETNERNDDPPEHKQENEKKKSRSSNYCQLSTETLLEKEQEVTRKLVELQTQLSHMRSATSVTLGNNELRAMNTKRYREEYVLGEIKAEVERRARKRMGQAIPKGGIQGGSTAGVAATTTSNQEHAKLRKVNNACTNVLADSLIEQAGGKRPTPQLMMNGSGGGVLKDPDADAFPGTSMPKNPGPAPNPPSQPSMPAMLPAPPQMGINFHGGTAMNAMAMMGAMGAAMASAGPTPEEMAQASMQFQRMQQGPTPEEMMQASMQFQQMQQMQQTFMASQSVQPQQAASFSMPAAFAGNTHSASSNVPAAFRRR